MPYRKVHFAPDEYYHVYNRGNRKQKIFFHEDDYLRFLFLILHFQSPDTIHNISRYVEDWKRAFRKSRPFPIDPELSVAVQNHRDVALVSFVLMPNHFHLTMHERSKHGIIHFMQRLLNAFAKYFNTRYESTGHLFEGPYKAVHVQKNEQLLYLSAYIHRNPHALPEWEGKEHSYHWSSYQDYVKQNRWGKLLEPDIVLGQFPSGDAYHKFVRSSGAKSSRIHDIVIDE